jgi:hypothetical protein
LEPVVEDLSMVPILDVCGCKDDLRTGWTWFPDPDRLGAFPRSGAS